MVGRLTPTQLGRRPSTRRLAASANRQPDL